MLANRLQCAAFSFSLASHPLARIIMGRKKVAPRKVISKKNGKVPARPNKKRVIPQYQTCTLTAPVHPPTQIFMSKIGVRGEILQSLSPPGHHQHTHIIVLPGNPGVVEYYRGYCNELRRRLPHHISENVSIHGLGYPGHDVRRLNGDTMYEIEDHVRYIREYLGTILPKFERSKLVFVGHSYGSYAALRVIKHLRKKENIWLVMLMPAIWHMGHCAGMLARTLLKDKWGTTTWTAWATTALTPQFFKELYLRIQRHDKDAADISRVVVDGRQRGLYENICSLARDEVKNILDPGAEFAKLLQNISKKSVLCWVKDDRWCPSQGKERIEEAFGNSLMTEELQGASHGFVLSDAETREVAKATVGWLCENMWSVTQVIKPDPPSVI